MTESKMHAKIAGLLRKAERTDNEAEREIFMAKAEELLIREGIDRATVEGLGEQKREEITTLVVEFGDSRGQSRKDLQMIAHQVARGLGNINTILTQDWDAYHADYKKRGRYTKDAPCNLTLVGYESDLKAAEWLISSITIQAVRASESWWRGQLREVYGSAPPASVRSKAKESFMCGFAQRVYRRLDQLRNVIVEEKEPGTALALLDRSKLVEQKFNELFPSQRSNNRRTNLDGNSFDSGSRAGSLADLGQSRIRGGRTSISA